MDLINKTRYAAKLAATVIDDERNMASLIVKAHFSINNHTLMPLDEQNWPIGQPVKTKFGDFDEDSPYRKQGVDVMLLGKAYPSSGGISNKAQFELHVGELVYCIDILGDRRWIHNGEELVPSEPEPFESIPLTWEYAYGGKCLVETGELPYHANPFGRGFYLDAEIAENGLLANLEDPNNRVTRWEDQPQPKGVAPLSRESSLRIMNSAEFDLDTMPPRIKKFKPSYFNNANPELILAKPPSAGTLIRAQGVTPGGGELAFKLPDGTFHLYVQLSDRSYMFPCHLDNIVLLTEHKQVLLGFRCCFRYQLNPLERRVAVLYGGEVPDSVPDHYIIDWKEFDQSEVMDV